MSLLSYRKSLAALVTIIFVSRTVYRYITWKKKKRVKAKEINEVIIFSDSPQFIRSQYSSLRSLVPPSADRILYYLEQSRYTLDICMHYLTSRDISYLIQKLRYRGVRIRYIADGDMAFIQGSETKRLHKQHFVVMRWMMHSKHMMHHKFCLVDASADIEDSKVVPFVMTGSLNWTDMAISGNWDSVVVMSDPKIVQEYRDEFERIWLKFEPPKINR